MNVYVPDIELLMTAGDQVPLIPLLEVDGNTGAVAPSQNGGIGLNTGVILGFTLTFKVVCTAHCPPVGVNV